MGYPKRCTAAGAHAPECGFRAVVNTPQGPRCEAHRPARMVTLRHLALVENDKGEVYVYTLIPGGVLGDRWLKVLGEPGVSRWDRGVFILEALVKGA